MSKPTLFSRVALIARKTANQNSETFSATINLLEEAHVPFVLEEKTAQALGIHTCPIAPASKLHEHADIICVVGGDGSLLHAAKIALSQNLPIIGINKGRIGFLADIQPQNLDALLQVLQGEYMREERFLLNVKVVDHAQVLYESHALNDMVLHKNIAVKMIEFDTSINGKPLCNQRADGLVVSTPTGSTAYALSGGGPIIHPSQNAMVIVPMLPHKLSSRPIVLDAQSHLDIHVSPHNLVAPALSCDGQESHTVPLDAHIIITEEKRKIQLIHPSHYDYFETLRQKLGWENKPKEHHLEHNNPLNLDQNPATDTL